MPDFGEFTRIGIFRFTDLTIGKIGTTNLKNSKDDIAFPNLRRIRMREEN